MATDESIQLPASSPDAAAIHRRLSICIATFRRAAFIEETLQSILDQLRPGVEVVVVDGASPDNTPEVVGALAAKYAALRYFREPVNSGIDTDYDRAVSYATGDFCWLMTDDDLIVPGAIDMVLDALRDDPGLVVLNTEVLDAGLVDSLESPRYKAASDLEFDSSADESFFRSFAQYLTFIGAVVIRRATWLARDRAAYYGSLFVHVGVIFQAPAIERIRFLATPLVKIRYGNAMWSPRGFDVWTFKWPELIWSFPGYSKEAKQAVCAPKQWCRPTHLLMHRALGTFSADQFRSLAMRQVSPHERVLPLLFLACPRWLANLIAVALLSLFRPSAKVGLYDLLRSPYASPASRLAARLPSFGGAKP